MIPNNQVLTKKFRKQTQLAKYFVLHSQTKFFEVAETYVALQNKFLKEDWWEQANLWVDMVVFPIITIISCLFSGEYPSLMSAMSLQKSVTLWLDYLEYRSLGIEIKQWTSITRQLGGPFISCNDPTYHVFVYADAMERLRSSLFT